MRWGFFLSKENLPEFFKVCINLNNPISWKIVSPFNLIIPRLSKIKGKESKNLPPTANKTAKANEVIKIKILTNLLIFLVEAFAIYLSNK